jgi:hypothetical protein
MDLGIRADNDAGEDKQKDLIVGHISTLQREKSKIRVFRKGR